MHVDVINELKISEYFFSIICVYDFILDTWVSLQAFKYYLLHWWVT